MPKQEDKSKLFDNALVCLKDPREAKKAGANPLGKIAMTGFAPVILSSENPASDEEVEIYSTYAEIASGMRLSVSPSKDFHDPKYIKMVAEYCAKQGEIGKQMMFYLAALTVIDTTQMEQGWKTTFTQKEYDVVDRYAQGLAEDGEIIPRGKPGDIFQIGEVPSQYADFVRGILMSHLAETSQPADLLLAANIAEMQYAGEKVNPYIRGKVDIKSMAQKIEANPNLKNDRTAQAVVRRLGQIGK